MEERKAERERRSWDQIGVPAPTLDETVEHHMEMVIQTMSYSGNRRDAVAASIERWVEAERVRRVIQEALHAEPDHD